MHDMVAVRRNLAAESDADHHGHECRAVKAVESKMAAVQARTTEHGARSHGSACLALSRFAVHRDAPYSPLSSCETWPVTVNFGSGGDLGPGLPSYNRHAVGIRASHVS